MYKKLVNEFLRMQGDMGDMAMIKLIALAVKGESTWDEGLEGSKPIFIAN